jgi:predicted amidohydrolase YtcJ
MPDTQNTTVFTNGRFFESGAVQSESHFHSTLAIQNGKISFIGSSDDPIVQSYRDAGAKVTDLGGKHVLPGFIDAHMQVISLRTVRDTNTDFVHQPLGTF